MNSPYDPALAATEQSKTEYPPPPRSTSPIQAVQGGYYIVAGLLVACALGWLQSSVNQDRVNIANLWPIRICGVILALYGAGLIYASRQRPSLGWATWGAILVAILVTAVDVVCMTTGVFPLTFMVDVTLQLGFLLWWGLALAFGASMIYHPQRGINQVGPQM